ncbi:Gfo/Idh/MocA family protein [Streptomyces sp. HUCO-GS316]|uniref:Gfo/Idh/MocA family protein n=1 Tax=Streptomyces sp. HUCO-GS316 TaxID=2692198 RepID=UPI003FA694FE
MLRSAFVGIHHAHPGWRNELPRLAHPALRITTSAPGETDGVPTGDWGDDPSSPRSGSSPSPAAARPPRVSAADGMAAVHLVEAARTSAATGRAIDLPAPTAPAQRKSPDEDRPPLLRARPCRHLPPPAARSLRRRTDHHGPGRPRTRQEPRPRPRRALSVHGVNNSTNPALQQPWFADPALSGGGAIMDHTVHIADLLDVLLDGEQPVQVYAQANRTLTPADGPTDVETARLITLT